MVHAEKEVIIKEVTSKRNQLFRRRNPSKNKFKEENRKQLSLFKKEAKDVKEFKVKLGGDDTEKVVLLGMKPYSSSSRNLI